MQAAGNATAFTIGAQASLVITAVDKAKLYGAALPVFTATYAGFINGDTPASVTGLQYSTLATIGSNVGTFTVAPKGVMVKVPTLLLRVARVLYCRPVTLAGVSPLMKPA